MDVEYFDFHQSNNCIETIKMSKKVLKIYFAKTT